MGEDVTWYAEAHDREQAAGPVLPLAGSWTLESFSDALEIDEAWRRWAYESAALDLALRQAGKSFAEAVGREPRPVAFVVSPGLGEPPSSRVVRRWLELDPSLRFKLDPASDWSDELIRELAETGAVVTADLKAYYRTDADPPPDVDLYRRVAEGFPEAYIEDPALTDETDPVLAPYRDRITWDAPIHSVADVEALPFPPRTLNSKPSRFGSPPWDPRLLRPLRRPRHRPLRRRHVRARPRPWADPVPRVALPPRCAERRRAASVQRARATAGPSAQPARARSFDQGVSLG